MGNVSLSIVLLYAGRSSAQLGKEVVESLADKLGGAFRLRQSSWNIELLRSAKLRALAAMEARDSDIVMIAMNEGEPLSPEMRAWFELWRDRQRSPGALVALLKRDEPDAPPIVRETLQSFAKQTRLDFFCHSEVRPAYPISRIDISHAAAV